MQQRPNPCLSPAESAGHATAARPYGFHTTLKTPLRLPEGHAEDAIVHSLAAFCRGTEPDVVPQLDIGELDGFFALLPRTRSIELDHSATMFRS